MRVISNQPLSDPRIYKTQVCYNLRFHFIFECRLKPPSVPADIHGNATSLLGSIRCLLAYAASDLSLDAEFEFIGDAELICARSHCVKYEHKVLMGVLQSSRHACQGRCGGYIPSRRVQASRFEDVIRLWLRDKVGVTDDLLFPCLHSNPIHAPRVHEIERAIVEDTWVNY